MKQITAFKLSDNTIVEYYDQAVLHQSKIDFENNIIKKIDSEIKSSILNSEIKSFILNNAIELKTIFDELIMD